MQKDFNNSFFHIIFFSGFAFTHASSSVFPISVLAMLGMAFSASFNFMPLHECVHRSAFKSRILNNIVMHIAGFLCLRPARHYFYYHWQHHKHTGDPALDSELQPSAIDLPVDSLVGYALYLSGLPFWFDAITTTLAHALGRCVMHVIVFYYKLCNTLLCFPRSCSDSLAIQCLDACLLTCLRPSPPL